MLKGVPFGNSLTVDFAEAAIEGEDIGKDNITDFIAISFSATDYVGHRFGVSAKETEDTYLRLDQDLARLFTYLDKEVGKGEYTVFLTADHAAVEVPSYLESMEIPGGDFSKKEFFDPLNAFLKAKFGSDELIKNLIEECDYYKIESVLLSRYQTTLELIKQIDYTKPKTIACSYFFDKIKLITIKKIFKKLRIGISVNPASFNLKYFQSISHLVNVFYYDLNIYGKNKIKTFSIYDCKNQIKLLKTLKKPIYIGGGIDHKNAKLIIKNTDPQGLDISRSLKDHNNNLCEKKCV